MSIFELRGTPDQVQLVRDALDRCDFPFARLVPELIRQWGKSTITVDWADLSATSSVVEEVGPQGRAHKAGPDVTSRRRVLGTAWTDGRIFIDFSCEDDPELAAEVLLSEAGHEVDFFYLTDAHREAMWDTWHDAEDDIGDHGHGWFDVGAYETWTGEAWMAGMVRAYSDVAVTLNQFVHVTTDDVTRKLRRIITPELGPPPWDQITPEPEPTPEPPPERSWWQRLLAWLTGWLR